MRNPHRSGTRSRQGFSIVYIPLILLLMVGFVALAVDTGRIRLSKAQLQGASDASARAGARALMDLTALGGSMTNAETRAVNAAQANDVAETSVVMQKAADLEWGIWNPNTFTFTVVADDPATTKFDERHKANACHTFARAWNARGTAVPLWVTPHVTTFGGSGTISVRSNLQAEAIAYVTGSASAFGFIGIDSLTSTGNTTSIIGSVASNGDINIGNANVAYDARAGVGRTLTVGPNGQVGGYAANLAAPLPTYPPVVAPTTYRAWPPLVNTQGKKSLTFLGSNNPAVPYIYYGTIPTNLSALNVDGYVRIITNADVPLNGADLVNLQTPPVAGKLDIQVIGSHQVSVGGSTRAFAHIYAPESTVNTGLNGTVYFTGQIIAKSLVFKGTVFAEQDNTGPVTPGSYKVQLVR